ncbi:MAG TPA: SDR family oxidoreductase, partial [Pyrinomonadaceae bacterium]|nr:SDR family oxidoreductase [Pyrinomonadaceae bacterium]
MAGELGGRAALVTGATSGIGHATALRFASEGARVALVGRDPESLRRAADEVRAGGGEALEVQADVTVEADARRAVETAAEAFGGLDVLVNAAGIISNGTVETTRLSDWDAMMNVNLRSVFHLMQLAVPHLERRPGSVVNVSSVTGLRAFPGVLAYCVSKAGVDQLTRCAALELAAKGVRVNAVNPGVVVTEIHKRGGMADERYAGFLEHSKTTHPLGRAGEPGEIADLIFYLA